MADRYIERLFRRLILAGVPMLPWAVVACSGGVDTGTCPQGGGTSSGVSEAHVEVVNPATDGGTGADGGFTTDAYQRCVESLDCDTLCSQAINPSTSGVPTMYFLVRSCQRVPTDGFAPGSDRVELDITYSLTCTGRRLAGQGTRPLPLAAANDVGAYLARAAFLEGVSVPAFERLARELAAHGAPNELVARARRSMREEIRHRRVMTALARRYGAEPAPGCPEIPGDIRPLAEVAMENAAEGCVRETFGAAVGGHQAVAAGDPALRAAMRAITRDEARHAALAWDVHAWSSTRLPPAARRRLRARPREEVDVLARESRAAPPTPGLIATVGLPNADGADRILCEMRGLLARA